MARARDSQRERLYAAELGIKEMSDHYPNLADAQAFVDSVTGSRWFRTRYPHIQRIRVTDGRSRRRGGAFPSYREIRMPVFTRRSYYLLHEIVHVVVERERAKTEEAWHGRLFVRTYIAFVERFMGKEAARVFRSKLREHRVKWNPRRPSFRPARPLGSVRS